MGRRDRKIEQTVEQTKMSRIRLKFIQAFVDQKTGGVYYYFRRAGFPRVRLPGLPGSDQFMIAYRTALAGMPEEIGANRSKAGSVGAAVAVYFASPEFGGLATGTQQQRRSVLERFRNEHGDKLLATLPQKFITLLLATMTPSNQRNWFKGLRTLMQFALTREWIKVDPTQGVKLAKLKSDGYHSWEETEIAQYEATHPPGSEARLALELLLGTSQRRGDVIRMGKQHMRDGIDAHGRPIKVLHIRQQKTGVPLELPVLPPLQAALDLVPADRLTFLVNRNGRPYNADHFTKIFRAWVREAGLPPECTPHGLRKAACRRWAEVGCSANEIAAFSGHMTLKEVARYTKAADQAKLARNAMSRISSHPSKPDARDAG
jgi:integrase